MNKFFITTIILLNTTFSMAQQASEIVNLTLRKIESYKTISHFSDQKFGEFGDTSDFDPLQGKCVFKLVPSDTVIGAYYSLQATNDITDNYNGVSLSRITYKDSTLTITDFKKYPSERRYITTKMLYNQSIIHIYNSLRETKKQSYSKLELLTDTTIQGALCKRILLKLSDTTINNNRSYFYRVISINTSTYLPLHSKSITSTPFGSQIIETTLSNYLLNDKKISNEVFSGNTIAAYFKKVEFNPDNFYKNGKTTEIKLQPNQKAPEWTLPTIEGENIALSDLKGKVILLEFSGVHCGYCLVAVPKLNVIHKKFNADNFKLVSVYSDEIKEKLIKYKERYNIQYTLLYDKGGDGKEPLSEKYGVSGIPSFVLIKQDGSISNIWVGYQEKIAEIIGKEIEKLLD